MTKVRSSDIDWPWWWPGSFSLAAAFWVVALLGLACLLGLAVHPMDRIEALEARPPCQCVIQEHCDFTDVVPDPGVGLVPPMGDERRCGIGEQTGGGR